MLVHSPNGYTVKNLTAIPVFLHDMFKRPQEILLKSEAGKLAFLQEFHGQLSQRIHRKERDVLIGITAHLVEDNYTCTCIRGRLRTETSSFQFILHA